MKTLGERVLDRKKASRKVRGPSMKSWETLRLSGDWAEGIALGKKEEVKRQPGERGVGNQRKVIGRRGKWSSSNSVITTTSCVWGLRRESWIWQWGRRLVPCQSCALWEMRTKVRQQWGESLGKEEMEKKKSVQKFAGGYFRRTLKHLSAMFCVPCTITGARNTGENWTRSLPSTGAFSLLGKGRCVNKSSRSPF